MAIHRVSADAGGLSVRLLRASGSPRAFSPRDDKGGIFTMKREVMEFLHCHCEEDRMDDAAIHRVSEDAGGFVCSLTGSQWIATGYALAMTRVRER